MPAFFKLELPKSTTEVAELQEACQHEIWKLTTHVGGRVLDILIRVSQQEKPDGPYVLGRYNLVAVEGHGIEISPKERLPLHLEALQSGATAKVVVEVIRAAVAANPTVGLFTTLEGEAAIAFASAVGSWSTGPAAGSATANRRGTTKAGSPVRMGSSTSSASPRRTAASTGRRSTPSWRPGARPQTTGTSRS